MCTMNSPCPAFFFPSLPSIGLLFPTTHFCLVDPPCTTFLTALSFFFFLWFFFSFQDSSEHVLAHIPPPPFFTLTCSILILVFLVSHRFTSLLKIFPPLMFCLSFGFHPPSVIPVCFPRSIPLVIAVSCSGFVRFPLLLPLVCLYNDFPYYFPVIFLRSHLPLDINSTVSSFSPPRLYESFSFLTFSGSNHVYLTSCQMSFDCLHRRSPGHL